MKNINKISGFNNFVKLYFKKHNLKGFNQNNLKLIANKWKNVKNKEIYKNWINKEKKDYFNRLNGYSLFLKENKNNKNTDLLIKWKNLNFDIKKKYSEKAKLINKKIKQDKSILSFFN